VEEFSDDDLALLMDRVFKQDNGTQPSAIIPQDLEQVRQRLDKFRDKGLIEFTSQLFVVLRLALRDQGLSIDDMTGKWSSIS
jgi:hypothetical protein